MQSAGALGSCAFGRFNRLGEQAEAVADASVELGLIDDFAASSLNDLSLAADFLDAEFAKLKRAASEVAEAEFERSVESFGGFKSPTSVESRRLFFKFD